MTGSDEWSRSPEGKGEMSETEMAGAAELGEPCEENIGEEELCLLSWDREDLEEFGKILDRRPQELCGRTVGMAMAERLLLVRTREGEARAAEGECGAAPV